MALVKCPECGKEISEGAKMCINCGYPLQNKKRKLSIKNIVILVVVALLILGSTLFALNYKLNDAEQKEVDFVTVAISNIGEVNVKSGSKIDEAEKLYSELSPKCQRHVTNHKELLEARKTYNEYKAEETSNLIDEIGEVTLDSEISISNAQKSYDNLSEDQKKMVESYDYLIAATEKIGSLKTENIESKISAIGTVTLESNDIIEEARLLYDKLTDDEKTRIVNYNTLLNAENEYEQLAIDNCTLLISSIGMVTLDSKEKIDDAQRMFDSLNKESQEKVANYSVLKEANNEYTKLVEEEEKRNKTLKPDDFFSTDKWEITYKKSTITAKLLPNSTSGYYTYYYADDDNTFIDIVFQIKNINTDILGIEDIVGSCEVEYEENALTKSYGLYVSNGSHIDRVYMWDGLDALDSTTLHVAIDMPRELQTNDKPISVKLTLAGQEKIINVR